MIQHSRLITTPEQSKDSIILSSESYRPTDVRYYPDEEVKSE